MSYKGMMDIPPECYIFLLSGRAKGPLEVGCLDFEGKDLHESIG